MHRIHETAKTPQTIPTLQYGLYPEVQATRGSHCLRLKLCPCTAHTIWPHGPPRAEGCDEMALVKPRVNKGLQSYSSACTDWRLGRRDRRGAPNASINHMHAPSTGPGRDARPVSPGIVKPVHQAPSTCQIAWPLLYRSINVFSVMHICPVTIPATSADRVSCVGLYVAVVAGLICFAVD